MNIGNWINSNLVSDAKKEKNELQKQYAANRQEQQAKLMNLLNENYVGASKTNSKTLIIVGAVLTVTTIIVLFTLKSGKNAKK